MSHSLGLKRQNDEKASVAASLFLKNTNYFFGGAMASFTAFAT